ncbi:MAG: undecaprenyl diphosphate synthase family protein, partial [Alphaproteobacteria bacterium]|nr:undecaprenyl diphosphate synthase family protein [Alphaproteobacteria bacterium]
SGEQRLSNFLLWEAAYAELVYQNVLWPDYGEDGLADVVEQYRNRDRRFGGRTAPVEAAAPALAAG